MQTSPHCFVRRDELSSCTGIRDSGIRPQPSRHKPMDLEVRHLRLVSEVAAHGSVTRAAERLHLTQSAISHQLRDIESRLGTALFYRMGKRMVVTPAGGSVLGAGAT